MAFHASPDPSKKAEEATDNPSSRPNRPRQSLVAEHSLKEAMGFLPCKAKAKPKALGQAKPTGNGQAKPLEWQ